MYFKEFYIKYRAYNYYFDYFKNGKKLETIKYFNQLKTLSGFVHLFH